MHWGASCDDQQLESKQTKLLSNQINKHQSEMKTET
jgi:hypothetical protein